MRRILRITKTENSIMTRIMPLTAHILISSMVLPDGFSAPQPNISTTLRESGNPMIAPSTPPTAANAMYFAAKSQRNFSDSTPIARMMPISFSSSLSEAMIVNRTVISTSRIRKMLISTTKTETISAMVLSAVSSSRKIVPPAA